MKAIEEHIKDKGLVNSYFTTDDFYVLHRVAVEAAKAYASDREAKYKELYEAQKELIIERDKPFANKYHGRAGELINKITALEQELGLKE